MSTRSTRSRQSVIDTSPSRNRKGVSPSLSPARTQKNSITRSPSGRSPARRSPSRKSTSNYPARKSPSRAVKENKVEKERENAPKSPAKRPGIKKEAEIKLYDISTKQEIYRTTRSRRLEYTVKDVPESLSKVSSVLDDKLNGFQSTDTVPELYNLRKRKTLESIPPRDSSNLRDYVPSDVRRSFTKSLSKSISKSISTVPTYSDEENSDETLERKTDLITRKLSTPLPSIGLSQFNNKLEFGGRIGTTLLMFLIPLAVFSILLACNSACSHKVLTIPSSYQSTSTWLDNTSAFMVLTQYILQAILVILPVFGAKRVDRGQRLCFNGFFGTFCTLSIIGLLDYHKLVNSDSLIDKTLQMAFVSYTVAILISLILYMKQIKCEENINPYGHPQYALYNFFMGREIQPNLMNINIKLWVSRVANITALVLAIGMFKRGIHFKENIGITSLEEFYKLPQQVILKPTILIFSMMQIIYSLNFLMKEYKIVSTFYWQSEGMGYLQVVSSALYPFYFTSMSKYVANTGISLPINMLIAASTLYVLGFLIMLISNNIKYEFRKNPLHPSLTHLDSMPTFHGKKLLVSNLWGVLRHPNYAGDILIHIALAIPAIYTQQAIAAAPALLTIIMLIHRSWRDHGRCKRRYGAAWQRYCKRVPSIVIPKIF